MQIFFCFSSLSIFPFNQKITGNSLKQIIKGKKLGWATDAIVYDEQPLEYKQSWTQRMRWSVGHIQCVKYYLKDLAKGVKEHKTLMNFDGFLYLMGMPMLIITLGLLVVNFAIYAGNGTIVHAANTRRGVTTDTINNGYYNTYYYTARRVF